jgi:hypothetical protein
MLAQRLVVTKIDDILELMKDYAKDIGPNSKATTLQFNPQLQQLALVFIDPDAAPNARQVLLAKFETKRIYSGGTTIATA